MSKRKPKVRGFNTPFTGVHLPEATVPAPPPVLDRKVEEVEEVAENGEILFAAAMRGVGQLSGNAGRVEPAKREVSQIPDDEQEALWELQSLVEGKGAFEITDAEEVLVGRAPGVSEETLERLRKGEFSFRRHLDLHGLTRDESKLEVIRFITEARNGGERCVLVVTGRGKRSPAGVAVLRQALPRWLSRAPLRSHVLAFSLARQVDGGSGAFYVLLRRLGVRPFGGGHR